MMKPSAGKFFSFCGPCCNLVALFGALLVLVAPLCLKFHLVADEGSYFPSASWSWSTFSSPPDKDHYIWAGGPDDQDGESEKNLQNLNLLWLGKEEQDHDSDDALYFYDDDDENDIELELHDDHVANQFSFSWKKAAKAWVEEIISKLFLFRSASAASHAVFTMLVGEQESEDLLFAKNKRHLTSSSSSSSTSTRRRPTTTTSRRRRSTSSNNGSGSGGGGGTTALLIILIVVGCIILLCTYSWLMDYLNRRTIQANLTKAYEVMKKVREAEISNARNALEDEGKYVQAEEFVQSELSGKKWTTMPDVTRPGCGEELEILRATKAAVSSAARCISKKAGHRASLWAPMFNPRSRVSCSVEKNRAKLCFCGRSPGIAIWARRISRPSAERRCK
ncbi:unnamed protein product [Amoebophrya sp. A120]|nr:unnamed protein product [Amoebophrya sp. A120]|eukprot:GSA120T00000650001.1